MVIKVLAVLIVASKGILSPVASFVFTVIRPSTLVSSKTESSRLRIISSKVIVMSLSTATPTSLWPGENVKAGAELSIPTLLLTIFTPWSIDGSFTI